MNRHSDARLSPASRSSGSSTFAPAPTGPAPTANPNASSRPCSANGPTDGSVSPAPNAAADCHHGCATTTPSDHTAPSATSRPTQPWQPDQRPWELHLAASRCGETSSAIPWIHSPSGCRRRKVRVILGQGTHTCLQRHKRLRGSRPPTPRRRRQGCCLHHRRPEDSQPSCDHRPRFPLR